MSLKKSLVAGLAAACVFAPSISQACQWVRVGDLGETLECRSNYRNFFKDNAPLFNKLLTEAAFIATGEAEKLTIDNWAIRNAVTVPEAHKLLEGRFEADKLVNEINAQIRQLEALDGETDGVDIPEWVPLAGGVDTGVQMPSAYMVGVTIPLNGDLSKVPFLNKYATFIPKPGGSVFVGWALIPQKVEFVMNAKGELEGPPEYVTKKQNTNPESYNAILTGLLQPAGDESVLQQEGRIRVESRFVVIPSIDAKTGSEGKYKSTYVKPTLGFVFGRNLVRSHQLLNDGPAVSVPGQSLRLAQKLSFLGPYLVPNWLITPIERYVDTVKIGYSYSGQNAYEEPTTKNVMQFNENAYLWLRFGDRLRRLKKQETVVEEVVEGKFRWGWFGVVGLFNDGESEGMKNGLQGDLFKTISTGIVDTVKDLVGRSEEAAAASDEPATLEKKIKELEESLEADAAAERGEKMPAAVRAVVEAEIAKLKAQLEAAEKADKEKK